MTRTNQSLWPPSNKNHTMYPKYNSLSLSVSQEFVSSWLFLNRGQQIVQPWKQAISNYPLTCVGYDSLSQGTCVYQHRLHCRKLLASTYPPHPLLWALSRILFGTLGPRNGSCLAFTAFQLRLRRSLVFELNRACPIINIVQPASSNLQTTSWADVQCCHTRPLG